MKNRYKIVISNKKIYKEIEMPVDVQRISVGTSLHCDFRLKKDLFFEGFDFSFVKENDEWKIFCSENVYVTEGDVRKLITKQLIHGDELYLRYHNSDMDILKLSFMIDFEFEKNDYERCIDISNINEICIGGTSRCQIQMNSPYIEDDFVVLSRQNGSYLLKEKNTKYGVYINECKKTGSNQLADTDFFALANYSFYIKNNYLYTSSKTDLVINGLDTFFVESSKSHHSYPLFNRNTRIRIKMPDEKIKVLDPIAAPKKPSGNIVQQLLPALIMLVVTIIFRVVLSTSNSTYIWVSLISMSLGICTSVASIITERRKFKKETKERVESYNSYISGKKQEIEESRDLEKDLLEDTFYSVDKEINIINDFAPELFDRDTQDADFMEIRLGTGEREALRQIEYREKESYTGLDELSMTPENLAEQYKNIKYAPITINLQQKNAIGFVGERKNLYGMMKNITIDLVVRHYYNDVRLFYLLEESLQEQFTWLRFLPHVYNDMLDIRNLACDSDSKNIIFEYLYKELTRRSGKDASFSQQFIVFVYNDIGLKRHPISRFMSQAAALGVHFIFFEEYEELLPNYCDDVITLEGGMSGTVISAQDSLQKQEFFYQETEDYIAERVATRLAPVYCEEVSLEGALTKNITLFELLNIMSADDIDLEKNWNTSEVYKSLAAPLGVKSKNQIVSLDLNEKHHGPHGLVAGTTGSGKSEILQSYILSMAVLFHPYEVGFVIIDFKGGGMVNQFKDLPHLVGAITNIDGREINRSLLSIKAELRKRQALFAEYGVNHVDAYIKLYKKGEAKIPLPHLILIVDEFAELKMDQPEFMKELISAARIGRSLGIHLILATQKPSGVVDAQIWSNSKFKLCLKVQNKEDSNEVLKTPLAAEIKEPGRAYLQVGNNEIFDLFQSAYSGAPASVDDSKAVKKFSLEKVNLSGRKTIIYTKKVEKSTEEKETQLDAIVEHIAKYCIQSNIAKLPGICLPPLGERYAFECAERITAAGSGITIPIGIFDDPNTQRQSQVELNISENNTFILGSSQTGKTSLIQTMVRGLAERYTPAEVQIYILDFASMALKVFSELNHVGGVLIASDDEKLKLFFKMMEKEVKTRKEKFSKLGITSYQSYRDAGFTDLPQIVIFVDNLLAFRELADSYDEALLGLCREGTSVGISINITAQQISGIGYKYLSTFANKYAYAVNDKSEYGSLFDRCRMEPKNVPGRGLVSIDKTIYEFQTYLGFEGEKEIQRVQAIKEFIAKRNSECRNCRAKEIPEVPSVLTQEYLLRNCGKPADGCYYLGMDYETVEAVMMNAVKDGYLAITGREHMGKSNYIKYLLSCVEKDIFDYPAEVYMIDDYNQKLREFADCGFVEKYTTDASEFEIVLETIDAHLADRAKKYAERGTAYLAKEPLLLIVINNSGAYEAEKITKEAFIQWKNIIKNYRNMKVFFVLAGIENAAVSYSANEILKHVKEGKNILFFDNLANIKLTDVTAGIQKQYKKPLETGDAFYITGSGVVRMRTPLYEEE